MLTLPEWQGVDQWRVFQHNDDEGHRATGVICDEVAGQRQVGTMEAYYEGYNDLNELWAKAPDQHKAAVRGQFQGVRPAAKVYYTSSTAEARRTQEQRRGPSNNPSFS